MILRFLLSRIGLSLIAAAIIIGAAVGLKYRSSDTKPDKGAATIVIEKIMADTIKSVNELEQNKNLIASTSVEQNTVTDNGTTPVSYTATDRFSQELFRQYISAKQSGQEISPDLSQTIADSVLSQNYNEPLKQYAESDLKVTTNSSPQALKDYGNALGSILSTKLASKESEYMIFQQLATGPIDPYIKDLEAIKKRYQSIESKLLSLPVPQTLVSSQLNIINDVAIFMDSVDGALNINDDPIGGLSKIARYQIGLDSFPLAIEEIKTYFDQHQVSFSPSESGYILTR